MLAHRYQIWPNAWGRILDPNAPIEKRLVGIVALAKTDPIAPFEVFNELVAMRLGQLLGLPVPSGIVIDRDEKTYFASCHLLAAGGELPRADLAMFGRSKRRDACGVMVFDGWIANADRRDENLWFDYYGDRYVIFDHGQSLFGSNGPNRLKDNANRLGVLFDQPCLAEFIVSFDNFAFWYERLHEIPVRTIRETVFEAAGVGVDQDDANECVKWLLNRRDKLPALFRNEVNSFCRLIRTIYDEFGGFDVLPPCYNI